MFVTLCGAFGLFVVRPKSVFLLHLLGAWVWQQNSLTASAARDTRTSLSRAVKAYSSAILLGSVLLLVIVFCTFITLWLTSASCP